MATIATSQYLDSTVTRTAGEAWTINLGGTLTVRTDHRVHAYAPAANAGSLGSITVNEGGLIWDSTAVRWMPYNSGTGNVPAIGTTVSQGGVSGYLLGVWASKTTTATTVGSAMPVSGFIKFREVSGGTFSVGALSGIGASATGPDVQGWISLPFDVAANLTFPRLGYHRARGGRFYLETTNGIRGQQFQVPSEGSTTMLAPGMFVETGVGTDEYELVPALNGSANGWSHVHLGEATGTTDKRQNFVKAVAGGIMQYGETWSAAATYASLAAQAGTYAGRSYVCTYTWVDNVVEIYYAAGHFVQTGHQIGLDFTSGDATADGIYTATVLDPYRFTVPLTGSGASGNVTIRQGITITFTAHGLNIGDQVYCDFTSGSGVDGYYTVIEAGSANSYTINHPTTVAVTSGNVSCLHSLNITLTAHGLSVGQTVSCDFTSGGATDGVYYIRAVPDANTLRITHAHSAAIASSNVTISRDIGYVPPAGLRTWIPSNIVNEVATTARATNTTPNATLATRPEWTTTSSGAIDLEYVYCCSGYLNLVQPYSVTLKNVIAFDSVVLQECATPIVVEDTAVGMSSGLDVVTLTMNNNYAGGTLTDCRFERGNTPGTTDHAVNITTCYDLTFNNVQAGIIQYARSTGYCFNLATCTGITFNNCATLNNVGIQLATCFDIEINDLDFSQRYNGYGLAAATAVLASAGSARIMIDGMEFGNRSAVDPLSQLPYAFFTPTASSDCTVRNIGSAASRIGLPAWAGNRTAMGYLMTSGSGNKNIRMQRVYVDAIRAAAPHTFNNSDAQVSFESCPAGLYNYSTVSVPSNTLPVLTLRNLASGFQMATTGQAATYGTHFIDYFAGPGYGASVLLFNEPNAITTTQYAVLAGTPRFNSSGGLLMAFAGDSCAFEDPDFRKGHTSFIRRELAMTGGTIANYDIWYQIDTGSGFSAWRNGYYERAGGAGTSGAYTFTVTDATGVEVGDYCFGTGLSAVGLNLKNAVIPKVTQVVGNTITVDVANTATVSGIIRFTHLPSEVLDSSAGFRLKYKITTKTANTTAITSLTAVTTSTAADQALALWPLDVTPFTFNVMDSALSPVTDYEYRIYLKDPSAGILGTTELDGAELYSSSSKTYTHEFSSDTDVVLQIIKDGYEEFTGEYKLNATAQTVNVILSTEYNI